MCFLLQRWNQGGERASRAPWKISVLPEWCMVWPQPVCYCTPPPHTHSVSFSGQAQNPRLCIYFSCLLTTFMIVIRNTPLTLTFPLFPLHLSLRSGLQHPGEHRATVLHCRWAAGASLHNRGPKCPRAFLLGVVGLQQLTGGRGGPQCRACPGPRLHRPRGRRTHHRAQGEPQRAPAQAAAPAARRRREIHLPRDRAGEDAHGRLHRPQQEVSQRPDHSPAAQWVIICSWGQWLTCPVLSCQLD